MYQVGNTIPGASKVVWGLEVVPHFCMVYLFTYLIILLIALIGTYLPVNRALKVHPVEALREE
jgi:ABC-type lipoprotein release transport system permease subunit